MNVMTKAWEIAREGFKKFGGKVKEYFAIALKTAWKIAKEMDSMELLMDEIRKGNKIKIYKNGKDKHGNEKYIGYVNGNETEVHPSVVKGQKVWNFSFGRTFIDGTEGSLFVKHHTAEEILTKILKKNKETEAFLAKQKNEYLRIGE
ncbi:hypothetical protein [Bacillus cereus]|uniref:hypothetical protein n=1 Tax=Bacillus cereus TaxID=1396 RepID=UPI000BFA0DE0|nr:hypothetical protein [Bacillus cereus]PFN11619.1 hypothetical protein COJ72_31115 [Bacillus cereus]